MMWNLHGEETPDLPNGPAVGVQKSRRFQQGRQGLHCELTGTRLFPRLAPPGPPIVELLRMPLAEEPQVLLLEEGEALKEHFRPRKNLSFLCPASPFAPPAESFPAALFSRAGRWLSDSPTPQTGRLLSAWPSDILSSPPSWGNCWVSPGFLQMHTSSSPQETLAALSGSGRELLLPYGVKLGNVAWPLWFCTCALKTLSLLERGERPWSPAPALLCPVIHFPLPLSSHPPGVTTGDLSCLCTPTFLPSQCKLADLVKAAPGTLQLSWHHSASWLAHTCRGFQLSPAWQHSQGSLFPSSALYLLREPSEVTAMKRQDEPFGHSSMDPSACWRGAGPSTPSSGMTPCSLVLWAAGARRGSRDTAQLCSGSTLG